MYAVFSLKRFTVAIEHSYNLSTIINYSPCDIYGKNCPWNTTLWNE